MSTVPAGVRVSTTAERAELLTRFAELVARGDLDGDEPIVASLLRIHASACAGPHAWEDLLSATRRVADIQAGVAERCTDAEWELALTDRDDALWLLLHGQTSFACPVCRRSSLPVDQWRPIGSCRRHGEVLS